MKKAEKILVAFALVGIVFKLMHWPMGGIILTLALSTLAVFYFPLGFLLFTSQQTGKKKILPSLAIGLALSLVPVGILFKLQYWPFAGAYLLYGSIFSAVVLAVAFTNSKAADPGNQAYYSGILSRAAILFVLAGVLYVTPTKVLLQIQHRDDPEMVRLREQVFSDPTNEAYEKELRDYCIKKDSLEMLNAQ